MKDLFMFLLMNMGKLGQLKSALLNEDDYASVEFEADNKIYSISLRSRDVVCDEDKETSK